METNRKELVEWVRGIYQNLDDADKRDALRFFPELAESEDERMIKALIEALTVSESIGELKFRLPEPTRKECITWLEKQKETLHVQETCKENANSFTDDEDEKIRRFIQDRLTDRLWNPTWKFSRDDVLAYLERKKEQKPAEWSEEDEKKIHFLSRLIEFQVKDGEYCFGEGFRMISKQEAIEMLKSLRPQPHWKPSQEEMEALSRAIPVILNGFGRGDAQRLESLRTDLQKLIKP